jgi:uncharacterized protein YqgV (UPF0045/DUF77 family)
MNKDYEEYLEKNMSKNIVKTENNMQVTIDISMYPNKEDFIEPIKNFIKKINTYKNLKIITYPTSTIIQGEFKYAMNSVQECMLSSHEDYRSIYVIKVIPGYQALE